MKEAADKMEGEKRKKEVLSMEEYLDRRKARLGLDRNESKCYDMEIKCIYNTKEQIKRWHY